MDGSSSLVLPVLPLFDRETGLWLHPGACSVYQHEDATPSNGKRKFCVSTIDGFSVHFPRSNSWVKHRSPLPGTTRRQDKSGGKTLSAAHIVYTCSSDSHLRAGEAPKCFISYTTRNIHPKSSAASAVGRSGVGPGASPPLYLLNELSA